MQGKHAIDAAVVSSGDSIFAHPIVIEGYADAAAPADALASSYARAQIVRQLSRSTLSIRSKESRGNAFERDSPHGAGASTLVGRMYPGRGKEVVRLGA